MLKVNGFKMQFSTFSIHNSTSACCLISTLAIKLLTDSFWEGALTVLGSAKQCHECIYVHTKFLDYYIRMFCILAVDASLVN